MTWVRLDDQFAIHKKLAGASDAAFRLAVSALCWSARNLADGYLDEDDLIDAWPRLRTPARYAAELVRREVWHIGTDICASPKCPPPVDKSWRIHDYFQYQFSKEQVMRDREAANKRQSRHRHGVSHGVTDGVSHGTPVPSRPVEGSVVAELNAGGQLAPRKPHSSNGVNGAASRQPLPYAEAVAAALNPERPPWDAFTKDPT